MDTPHADSLFYGLYIILTRLDMGATRIVCGVVKHR